MLRWNTTQCINVFRNLNPTSTKTGKWLTQRKGPDMFLTFCSSGRWRIVHNIQHPSATMCTEWVSFEMNWYAPASSHKFHSTTVVSKHHPSFNSLPIEISGEVTAAMMKRSLKRTDPSWTSAILAPRTLIGLPWASTYAESLWKLSSCKPMWTYSSGKTEPSAPESSTTSTGVGLVDPIARIKSTSSEMQTSLESKSKLGELQTVHESSLSVYDISKCMQRSRIFHLSSGQRAPHPPF